MISDVLTTIRDIIANDQTLKDWCKAKFYQEHTVFLGVDEDNPPDDENYPVIALSYPRLSHGDRSRIVIEIDMAAGIINEEIEEDSTGRIKTMAGIIDAENFIYKAEKAILSGYLGKTTFKREHLQMSVFPQFISFSTVTVEQLGNRKIRG